RPFLPLCDAATCSSGHLRPRSLHHWVRKEFLSNFSFGHDPNRASVCRLDHRQPRLPLQPAREDLKARIWKTP
ncbi:hypothetical protein E2562_010204, partial [Oryza meyeriana var. granulata]